MSNVSRGNNSPKSGDHETNQQAQDVETMPVQRRPTVYYAGPTSLLMNGPRYTVAKGMANITMSYIY